LAELASLREEKDKLAKYKEDLNKATKKINKMLIESQANA